MNNEPGNENVDLRRSRRPNRSEHRSMENAPMRLPPHSIEAEQGVLGCILLSPYDCISECIEKFRVGSKVFYDVRHQGIYEIIVEMSEKCELIDIISLQQRLKDKQQLEAVGGLGYLAALPDKVPSAANLSFYVQMVREKYILRKLVSTCTEIVGRVYEHEGQVDELLDAAEADILSIAEERSESIAPPPKELALRAINLIETYYEAQGRPIGISTGYTDLDKKTRGMKGGEMIVVAARPSMGKTSLAMNIAESVAVDQNIPVGVFSLEMSGESLMLRLICSRARLNIGNIIDGFITERDGPKLTAASGKLGNSPLYIDDTAGLSIMELRARARRMAKKYGIKFFVVDYLQLLHSTNKKATNRQQEIADISNGLKNLAKELNIPVMVLAQLNRDSEKENRKPRMSDLRESGAIEQDADFIGLLYKAFLEEGEVENEKAIEEKLIIAKQRNGPSGIEVDFVFLKDITKFESASKIGPEEPAPQQPPAREEYEQSQERIPEPPQQEFLAPPPDD